MRVDVGITSVVLVIGSSSSFGQTGMWSFPAPVGRPGPPGMWGVRQIASGRVGW